MKRRFLDRYAKPLTGLVNAATIAALIVLLAWASRKYG